MTSYIFDKVLWYIYIYVYKANKQIANKRKVDLIARNVYLQSIIRHLIKV